MSSKSSFFQRIILPGFAFKAVVIGGGYATGRELATFFLPSGPQGGLYGMLLVTAIWSAICILTFLFALLTESRDYKAFFAHLLGPLWIVFEVAYVLAMVVVLAVFAAAAGAIFNVVLGVAPIVGGLTLVAAITTVVSFGNDAVERLFKYVTVFLYVTYATFLILSLTHFGGRIAAAFAEPQPTKGWIVGGVTYAGYNLMSAVVILPVLRHMRSRNDAIIAGALAGPLAMAPAILFFLSMTAFYPQIKDQVIPADFLLTQMKLPAFRLIFQLMIFSALLESGAGQVHAMNERAAHAFMQRTGRVLPIHLRLALTLIVLIGSAFVADWLGLVTLIANGYRYLAYVVLAVFAVPLVTVGAWRILKNWSQIQASPASEPLSV